MQGKQLNVGAVKRVSENMDKIAAVPTSIYTMFHVPYTLYYFAIIIVNCIDGPTNIYFQGAKKRKARSLEAVGLDPLV